MDKVTLDGKVYEKSAVVAKRFGYTTDYIGQLSRADKIDAQLVGRSWYVHAPSVEEYQETLYEDDQVEESKPTAKEQTTQSKEKADIKPKSSTSRIDETRIKPETITKRSSSQTSSTATRPAQNYLSTSSSNWSRISYEPDSGELLPQLDKKAIDINVFDQKQSSQEPAPAGLRIHCRSPQFSMIDTVDAMPSERRHRNVAVEQMRMSKTDSGSGDIADKDNTSLEPDTSKKTPKNSHHRLFTALAVFMLVVLYTMLFVVLLSVRTVTYDTTSGAFSYTFHIDSLSDFKGAF